MASTGCRVCLRAALLTVVAVLSAVVVLRKAQSLTPLTSSALVGLAEASELKSLENMDPHSVRLHWFQTKCLGVKKANYHSTNAYRLVVWTCKPMEDAWWTQRFNVPEEGKPGRIKSPVGQVEDVAKREFCLVVHHCFPGTPVLFMPCGQPGIHSEFVIVRRKDGTIKIHTPQCPRHHCIDMPDKNTTLGNFAQIWPCSSSDPNEEAILKTDEVFSVGISRHDEDVFKAMVLSHAGPPSCKLTRAPLEKDLVSYHSHCHCSRTSNGGTPLSFSAELAPHRDNLGAYATIWSLWCEVRTCSCSAIVMGVAFANVTRESRSTECGALMLSTHPTDGECPPDLKALEGMINASGEVDCQAGQKAVRELAAKPSSHRRLMLTWLEAAVVGLSFQDTKSFGAMDLNVSSGNCTVSQPEGAPLVLYSVRCPQDERRANLSLEMTARNGSSNLSNGSSVWALWCVGDRCKCKAVSENREFASRGMEREQRGCAALMLTVHPNSSACPPDLLQLQHSIEGSGGDRMDCEAGYAAAGQLVADPDADGRLRLKWVDVVIANNSASLKPVASSANHSAADHSAPNKAVMSVLNFASVMGGVAAVGTVPAWPAMAQFAQFMVMMASNQAQLGMPEQFSGFSRELLKFDSAAKPLEGTGLEPSSWLLSKERLMQQKMAVLIRALNSSRTISPGTACLLGNFYDPVQRQLGNLTAALEVHDGEDPCASSEDGAKGRRLAEEKAEVDPDEKAEVDPDENAEVDPDDQDASDGGDATANIRQRLEELQDTNPQLFKSLEDALESTEMEFSVTKIDVICLVVLPALVSIYLVAYAVLHLLGHKLTFVPHLRPSFLLIFLVELASLGTFAAWADVMWHERFLQYENPFRVLHAALEAWDGGTLTTPVVSAFMAVVSCFEPVVSLLRLWDGLHLGVTGSKVVATIVFLLGPCLLLLVCVLHTWCGRLGRHERTNRHLDAECGSLKASQPVLGSFLKRVLFYESTAIAKVSEVKAHGQLLVQEGRLRGEVRHTSLVDALRGEQATGRREDTIPVVEAASDHTLLGPMSDTSGKLDFAYRFHGFLIPIGGLPGRITLAFDGVSGDVVPGKLEVRLHVARGSLLFSVSFQARSGNPKRPLPGRNKLLEMELVQSIWGKCLLDAIAELVRSSGNNDLELGGLRWTLWDTERNERNPWILASFNVLLLRTAGTERAAYVRSASSLRERLLEDVEASPGSWDALLRKGWDQAGKVLKCLKASYRSTTGAEQDGPVWREIAARGAKANLTPEQREWAFAEVDLSRVHAIEFDEEDVEEESAAEAGGGAEEGSKVPTSSPPSLPGASAPAPRAEPRAGDRVAPSPQDVANSKVAIGPNPLVPANRPLAPKGDHPRATGHAFFSNVSVSTSYEDDRLERPKTELLLENGQIFLRVESDAFLSLKSGDNVEVWAAGKNEDEAPPEGHDSSSTPLTKPSWKDVLNQNSRVKVQADEVKPWHDRSDPFSELTVARARQTHDDSEWLEAVRRIPKAYVGKVQASLQLAGCTACYLTLFVTSGDLLHLDEKVPLTVPFEHLQLPSRDLWRAFYLSDHRTRRGELPQVTKIINGLVTFGMVLAVVLLPQMSAGSAQHAVGGPSLAMLVLGIILVIAVVFRCWNEGATLQFGLATLKRHAKAEWARLVKAFERKKMVTVLVHNLNYTKVASDPRLSSLFLQVLRGAMGSADPSAIHAKITVPDDSPAVIYVLAEPRPKKSESKGKTVDAQLQHVNDIDPKDGPGCVPTAVEQGIRSALARRHVGDEKGQGYLREMKASSRKLTGIGETTTAATRICEFRAGRKTLSELAEKPELDLQSEMEPFFEDKTVAVELTAKNLCGKLSVPASTEVNGADDIKTAIESEEELRAVRLGDLKVAVSEMQHQRCPCWLGLFGLALDVLKLLLVLSVPIVGLADGGNALQAFLALLISLALWLLSRLTWTRAVEGSLFKSCTMEIGQLVLIFAALLCQLGLLNGLSASCIMIIGVLWSIALLFCRSHKDRIKMWQMEISSAIRAVQESAEPTTEVKQKLRLAFKLFKVRFSLSRRIFWHGVSADTRDPAWRWGILFCLLFLLSVIAIVTAQNLAAKQLGPTPLMLAVFALSFAATAASTWLFFTFLPRKLLEHREASEDVGVRHTRMAMDTLRAVWGSDSTTMAKDDLELRNKLMERSRAHTPAAIVSARDVDLSVPVPVPYLFEPLGGLAPFSSACVVADSSIMQGVMLLHSGQVPLKRLFCTPRAWAAPRNLVEHTPVQMSLQDLSASSESTNMQWLGQLVCSVQVVNFVGLSIGKTQDHDGVLSLWISPELDAVAQLKQWIKTILRFFWDYGASFERGSGVYAVLENLIWGVRVTGAERGEHLHEGKFQSALVAHGDPHEGWLDRNVRDLVNIVSRGPDYPQREDWGDVSSDEEDPDVLRDRDRVREPEEGNAAPTPRVPVEASATGTLNIRVLQATNLPLEKARCLCPTLQLETQPSQETSNPVWNQTLPARDFCTDQHRMLQFQVKRADLKVVLGSGELLLPELVRGQTSRHSINLETEVAKSGCCAGKAASVLTVELCLLNGNGEDEADGEPGAHETAASDSTTASSPPERTRREQPCAGFCGGPLTWALVYPPTVPQLLHVVVAAEDLRVGAQPARLAPFGSAPSCSGGMPPLREQRALPRERMVHERLELPAVE